MHEIEPDVGEQEEVSTSNLPGLQLCHATPAGRSETGATTRPSRASRAPPSRPPRPHHPKSAPKDTMHGSLAAHKV